MAHTGWTWDYIAQNVDLHRLKALNHHWAEHPPLQRMIAEYFGIKPSSSTSADASSVEEAAEFIPVETLSKDAFDALLAQHGLPIKE